MFVFDEVHDRMMHQYHIIELSEGLMIIFLSIVMEIPSYVRCAYGVGKAVLGGTPLTGKLFLQGYHWMRMVLFEIDLIQVE